MFWKAFFSFGLRSATLSATVSLPEDTLSNFLEPVFWDNRRDEDLLLIIIPSLCGFMLNLDS
jgi:hypothetical protein